MGWQWPERIEYQRRDADESRAYFSHGGHVVLIWIVQSIRSRSQREDRINPQLGSKDIFRIYFHVFDVNCKDFCSSNRQQRENIPDHESEWSAINIHMQKLSDA